MAIGPGAQQEVATDVRPLLEGANEYEYVTILNPLTEDFIVRVAQDVPVNMPMQIRSSTGGVQSERDLLSLYGDTYKNPDFQSKKHIFNDLLIPAGQTRNLRGNEAQVAVKQIVNELMQRDGHGRLLSDPTLRAAAESRVVMARNNVQDIMDGNIQTPRNQIDAAISKSNEVHNEQPFPGLSQAGSSSTQEGGDTTQPDPNPGTGVTYSTGNVGKKAPTDSK